jgi:hypothetical protein
LRSEGDEKFASKPKVTVEVIDDIEQAPVPAFYELVLSEVH